MSGNEEDAARRVVFHGVHDLAAGWYVPRVVELAERFDPANAPTDAMGVIELHNVQQYLENGLLPNDYSKSAHAMAAAKTPQINSVVAQFFSSIDSSSCESLIKGVDRKYHADLLELLGRYRAFERCDASLMLRVLDRAEVHLGTMLACKRLVNAYDTDIRDRLLASPRNAEHLIRKYLQRDVRDPVNLPRSLSPSDARNLLERYIDDRDANPNYLGLIESAPISVETGIDAQLKLRARRRNGEWTEKFFQNNQGFKTGTEVGLSDSQREPLKFEIDESDGLTARCTYSRAWLDQTIDNPSILNNFQHLFEFADRQVLLTLPSYPSQLGVFERFMGTPGRTHYQVGAGFRAIDMSSHLQTRLYLHYLENKGKDLESVISWFFEEYLPEEFDATNFSFRPSSAGASYLERVRHLFAEMESVLTQFTLWVENRHLDPDLLAMTSDPVRYKQGPSRLPGKYVYSTQSPEIAGRNSQDLWIGVSRDLLINFHLAG